MGKKKYIKNSKGVTMSVTTDTLGLEKPLLNENYDIDVHNRNMDKIDEDLKPIDDSYIIELFQHDGDTSSPKDYYTKDESDEKFATKEEVENIDLSNLATKSDVENLKQSVSNGKQLIASAITDKEVPTSNTDSFQTMANNIRNIKTGINVNLDGNPLDYDFDLRYVGMNWEENSNLGTIPYSFYHGSAVVYNNEIHILGGLNGSTNHYKWNGSSWSKASNKLPFSFYYGCAVIYNNEIHILGSGSASRSHHKWNGSSWVSVSTLPYDFSSSSAVVCNNKIHILGSGYNNYNKAHYSFDGSSWKQELSLPYPFIYGTAAAFNNEIYILGGNESAYYRNHYRFNGNSWTSVGQPPYNVQYSPVAMCDDGFYILGSNISPTTSSAKCSSVYRLSKV